jgi:predicted small secreted protein
MKKRSLVFTIVASTMLLTGCSSTVQNSGPTIDLIMHGKVSDAKVTYNFSDISKSKKLFLQDMTATSSKKGASPLDEYEQLPEAKQQCSAGEETIRILKKAGYVFSSNEKDADVVIKMENLGCGRYGAIKDHIRQPIMVTINNEIAGRKTSDATSFANTAAGLSSVGANSNLSGGFAALSILSLFSNENNRFFSSVAITVENKEKQTVENAVYYTFSHHGKDRKEMAESCNSEIANRFEMEI